MGSNGVNLQDLFNQRFGAGAYESGINNAYNAGRSIYNAKQQALQQQMFDQLQKQLETQQAAQDKLNKPINDLKNAADYWNDPKNNTALHQAGAWRTVQDLQNDPEMQAQLKAQGYDVKALADQAYNVATGGKIKSAAGFKAFYNEQTPDAATRKQNQGEIQNVRDADAAAAAKAKLDAQNKANYDNSWYGKILNGIGSGLNDTGNALGSAAGQVGKSIGNEYNKVTHDPQGIGHGLYNAGNDFFNGLNELGNRFDDQATGTLLGQNMVNKEHQQQQNLLSHLKLNPKTAALAQTNQSILNQSNSPAKSGLDQLANLSGGFAGNVAPYLVGDGLLGAASKIGKVGEVANVISNPLARKVAGGALSGAVGGGLGSGGKALGGENQNAGDVMKNILENAAIGGGAEGVLNGGVQKLLQQLNLKGQAEKMMQGTGSAVYNEDAFKQALQDANAPSGNLSNVLADTPKEMPKPFEQKYNLPQQPVKQPVNTDILKQSDWFGFGQQGNNAPLARGWQLDPTVPKGEGGSIRSLAEDALNRSNAFSNAPAEGFNQRLLNVQQDMNGTHQTNKAVQNELKDAVQKQYEYLKGSMGKGTDSGIYTNGKTGNFKEATGGRYSVSNNDKWYQDFFKATGRKPTDAELKQIAEIHVRNGFQDNLGDIPAWKPKQLQQIHDQIDELHSVLAEHPEQSDVIAPILKGLSQDEARLTAAHNNALSGKTPNINDLYLGTKGAKDPKTFDELIKMAQMEHGANNPSLTSLLRMDPKVKAGIDSLNAIGKGAKKAVATKKTDVLKGLNVPELKGAQQSPHDLLQALKASGGKVAGGGDGKLVSEITPQTKKGLPKLGDLLNGLTEQKPYILDTVKTSKNITQMSKEELQSVANKLEKQHELLSSGGKGNTEKVKAVESDMAKVQQAGLKYDLQFFGEKANPIEAVREKLFGKAPEKTPQQAAIERSQQEVAAKKIQEKGGNATTDTVSELQKIKDIHAHQTLGMNLYEVADRLPKEMGDRIKSALDTAKANHMANLEQRSNELYDKVVQELGIKKGSKDSALVQDFGEKTLAKNYLEKEGVDVSKVSNEELDKINLEQLKAQRPNDWQKIVEADKFFRENYNQMIDEVNATVKEIYPNNPDKIVPKREDYYHHFNELEGFEGFKNMLQNDNHIDPHLAGISPNTKPKTRFAGFKLARGNGAYKSDAVGGYLKYLEAASHSTHVDPVIPVIRSTAEQLATATESTKNANNLKAALEYHANDIAGKTNPLDRVVQDNIIGRQGMQFVNKVNGHIKKNMILGNISSVIGQIGNIPLTLGKAKLYAGQGTLDTLKDMAAELIPGVTKDASSPINQSQFLKERFKGKLFNRFEMGLLKKPEKMAAWMLEQGDKTGTYLAWNSMYRKGLAKGVADPIKYADTEARHIIAGRGIGEVPIYQKSKLVGLVAPFSLEVGNAWKVLGKQMKEKDFGGVITFLAASAVLNAGMRQLRGSDVSFNPIGAALDGVNRDKTASATDKAKLAGANVLGEIAGNIPGGSYIPQILGKMSPTTKQSIFGNNSPDRYGTGVGVLSTAFKPIIDAIGGDYGNFGKDSLAIALPFGGNQAKKTLGGIESLSKGGAYDKKGNLEYPVNSNNTFDLLKSLLLGPSTTGQGQKYFNTNGRALSSKDTAKFQNMQQLGQGQAFYDGIVQKRALGAIDKQIKTVRNDPSLSPADKQKELMRLLLAKMQQASQN